MSWLVRGLGAGVGAAIWYIFVVFEPIMTILYENASGLSHTSLRAAP